MLKNFPHSSLPIALGCLLFCGLSGCGSDNGAQYQALVQEAPGLATVVADAGGAQHRFYTTPRRVICLTVGSAELAERLGAADQLLARPSEAMGLDSVRALPDTAFGFEILAKMQPDCILADARQPALLKKLRAYFEEGNLPIVALDLADPTRLPRNARLLGDLLNKTENAKAYAKGVNHFLEALRKAHPGEAPAQVGIFLSYSPLTVAGDGHGLTAALAHLQAQNVFANFPDATAAPTPEEVAAAQPTVLFVPDGTGAEFENFLKTHPQLALSPAVATGQIYGYSPADFLNGGPRTLLALLTLATALYPNHDFSSALDGGLVPQAALLP